MIDSGDDSDVFCAWYDSGRIRAANPPTQTEPSPAGCCGANHAEWTKSIHSWSFDEHYEWRKERERIARLESEWEEHKRLRGI